ncbi:response regulator [Tianweitania sp. BSSL-BM11]|uniref:Response regulator n=1 Tax=Tianweitania aestuarii TaxID=2814886 RepID=A0ABS5RZV5_9HYPH|nr:response regulator [Tianweitania aestuarii]MBS9722527.1 response regulator [Tianweitania aestuarii]
MADQFLKGLRVLLLEDEFLIALDVEQICYDEGCAEVQTFRDLSEVNDAVLNANSFDLAIVDVMMGEGMTLPLADKLRSRGVPFVFSTGLSRTEDTFRDFSDVPVVTKPYASHQLTAAMQAALSTRRS